MHGSINIRFTAISCTNLPDSFHITCQQWLLFNLEMGVTFLSTSWKAVLLHYGPFLIPEYKSYYLSSKFHGCHCYCKNYVAFILLCTIHTNHNRETIRTVCTGMYVCMNEWMNEWKFLHNIVIHHNRILLGLNLRKGLQTYSRNLLSYFLQYHWHTVAQLVEALRYHPEGRGFDSQWCHQKFSLT